MKIRVISLSTEAHFLENTVNLENMPPEHREQASFPFQDQAWLRAGREITEY